MIMPTVQKADKFHSKFILPFYKNQIALKKSKNTPFSVNLLNTEDFRQQGIDPYIKELQWANEINTSNNTVYLCGEWMKKFELPISWTWLTLREFAYLNEYTEFFHILSQAFQIIQWDKHHQFCGQCGEKTTKSTLARSRNCTQCQLSFFPRISPSGIVIIKKEDQILLARSPHFAPGIYSAIAGFVEVGETVEQAIVREVHEEVGIQIHQLQYRFSQSWPFPHSLMLGYTADYLSGDLVFDGIEIEDARWFKRNSLPKLPMKASIAWSLINWTLSQFNS